MEQRKDNFKRKSFDRKNDNKKSSVKLTLVGDLLFEQPFYDAINNGEDKNKLKL